MKRLCFLLLFTYMTLASIAQNLMVEGVTPNLFISHTVFAKENFYSIGRLYNQSPKAIAAFNNITLEKGLSIGQHIKIPLNEQNFATEDKATEGEKFVPITHKVAQGENIFKIGTACNVTAQSIRQWNLLSSDKVAVGASLIVGHLKVKSAESKLATGNNATQPAVVVKSTPATTTKPAAPAPIKDVPVEVASTNSQKGTGSSTVEVKKTPANEPVKKAEPVNESKNIPVLVSPKEASGNNPESEPATKPKQASQPRIENKNIDLSTTPASAAEGVFSAVYASDITHKTLNTKKGEAATFKSTSGWQDKKFYVLINDVAPGTIVKLNSGNSKTVYAKVLGSIPEMKENNGLLLRVSNAAASYLGIANPLFPVEITFYQ